MEMVCSMWWMTGKTAMRNSVGTASEEKRSLGIRIGKSPTLKMTNISGTETEFNSLDSEKITGLVFSKIGVFNKE